MTIAELEIEVATRDADGRRWIVMAVPRQREPKSRRVQVVPGLFGTLVGWDDGCCIVDVAVSDVRRYLTKRARRRA